jgi:cell division protein ZapA (FtsZ GTPase activity inhibitor)
MVKRRVEVTLMEQTFAVRTEREDAEVHALGALVSRRFEELRRSAKGATSQQVALLLALNLADELQALQDENEALRNQAPDVDVEEVRAVCGEALERVRAAIHVVDQALG